ncbi:MAG: hypothetical protein NTZ72_14060 [Afipia sp.]|nr:hypothetical protein [Afipia sp.]
MGDENSNIQNDAARRLESLGVGVALARRLADLPFLIWLPKVGRATLQADLLAGLTGSFWIVLAFGCGSEHDRFIGSWRFTFVGCRARFN